MAERIDVVCVMDENYIPHFAALLKSISQSKGLESVFVHAIHDSVPKNLRVRVEEDVKDISLSWYSVENHRALELPPLLQISRATYLRLLMEEVLSLSLEKVIYIDIDVIVTSSLMDLWRTDLRGMACAAVIDPGVSGQEFSRKHSLDHEGEYFNAGVLLLDMVKVRSLGTLKNALNMLLIGANEFDLADQDALNFALWRQWLPIDAKWNFQREFLYDKLKAWRRASRGAPGDPNIIHFTESMKPWKRGEWHPHSWLYWRALLKTSFVSEVLIKNECSWFEVLKSWLRYHLRKPHLG